MSPSRSTSGSDGASAHATATVQPQPYLHPVAKDAKSGEPIFGEITHGDTKFIGKLRYVPQKDVNESKDEREEGVGSGEGWCGLRRLAKFKPTCMPCYNP